MRSNIKFYSLQKNKNDFWNQDCYIGGKRKKEFYIVAYDEPCVVRKKDDIKCFDLLFAIQFSLTPIDECFNFLQYHYEKSFKKNISEFTIFLDNICLEYNPILKEKHEPFYRDSIDKIVGSEIELNKNSAIQKLKWLGTPSQFSYLFLELAEKGFIEIPPTNGESSYSKYAKVCWDLFDFDKTTLENLKKELNPNKNTLTDTVRSKFTIPQLSDISKKKKK